MPSTVTISFFKGTQGKLWLALLVVSPVLAALFAAFAWIYRADGLIIIIGCCAIAAVCIIIFAVCLLTARLRTSRWTADTEGIAYFCLGRRRLFFSWEEVREAGFLLLDGERRTDRLRLYLSTSELRGKLKGGVFAGREEGLSANRRGAGMMLYPVPACYGENGGVRYPLDDELVAFVRAHVKRPLRHENFFLDPK